MKVQTYINSYLDYCRYRKELDMKTIKAYRIDLKQFVDFITKEEPDKGEIENYIIFLHKQYKQKTVKRKIASIKAFYCFLEEEEFIEVNPFRKIKVKFKEVETLPRIIPRKEIEQLLNHMYKNAKSKYEWRDLAVVETLFATGARVYEISNIKMENVDLDSGVMKIMGKGRKERYAQIGDEMVLSVLRNYYISNKKEIKESGYFFVNRQGKRFTEQSIRLMIKKYSILAGIDRNITPHMFRHSFATYLIEEGVDISCVQQILGHSSIKTTQIYIHVAARIQAEILRCKHPRNKMNIVIAA